MMATDVDASGMADGSRELLMNDPDEAKSAKAFAAMLQMKKLDIEALRQAAAA